MLEQPNELPLRVADMLEDHIFEASVIRRCTICVSNLPASTDKTTGNSKNKTNDNSNNNENLKPDLQMRLLIQMIYKSLAEVITMGTKQMTNKKLQQDVQRESDFLSFSGCGEHTEQCFCRTRVWPWSTEFVCSTSTSVGQKLIHFIPIILPILGMLVLF